MTKIVGRHFESLKKERETKQQGGFGCEQQLIVHSPVARQRNWRLGRRPKLVEYRVNARPLGNF